MFLLHLRERRTQEWLKPWYIKCFLYIVDLLIGTQCSSSRRVKQWHHLVSGFCRFPGLFQMFSVPAALFFPHSPSFLLVILLVLAIKVLSGDSFKHITSKCSLFSKVVPSVINRFHPPSSSHESEAFIVLFFQFVSSLSSLFSLLPPPLCPQITPWSQTAEGCRSSSRPATSSREPAAPGW